MKKGITWLANCLVIFTFAGCNRGNSAETSKDDSATVEAANQQAAREQAANKADLAQAEATADKAADKGTFLYIAPPPPGNIDSG
jgi:hypothetical protein